MPRAVVGSVRLAEERRWLEADRRASTTIGTAPSVLTLEAFQRAIELCRASRISGFVVEELTVSSPA